jgi:signal transduction histidine kinase/DNA-binding response OmpR family regulator/ligand-binding sensor domain-containing protein
MKKTLSSFMLVVAVAVTYPLGAYNLRQVSKHDGLSNSAIQTMCQDSDGVMWFGSVDGLNIYNGRTLRVYPSVGDEALSGNLIENMIETAPGIFWIQTNYGLDRFDKRRRTVERFSEFTSNYRLRHGGDVQLLFVREAGGGGGEVVYWNEMGNFFDRLPLKDVSHAGLLDYLVTDDNTLWLLRSDGHGSALSIRREGNGKRTLVPAEGFRHHHPLRYAFHEGGAIYFVDTTGTLYEYDTSARQKYYIAHVGEQIAQRGDISSIVRSGGDYFVGFKTDGLICLRHTPDSAQKYRVEQIDIRAGVFCLLNDNRQNIVWIGTDGQGVYIYSDDSYSVKPTIFENFTHRINKPVRAIFLDREHSLWVATKGDGIFRLRDYDFNGSVSGLAIDYFTTQNSRLSNNSVYSLTGSVRESVLWIGTDSGVNWFDYGSGVIRDLAVVVDGEPLRWVHGVVQTDDDTLWIATVGAGMVRVDLGWSGNTPYAVSAQRFTIGDGGMSANYFFTVYDGDPGAVWFGNRGYGAYRRDLATGVLTSVRFDGVGVSRSLNDIFCIVSGEGSEMWFGTSAGLVKRTGDGALTVYNERSGFLNSTIHGMLMGHGGDIWLSTNFGIIRFNPLTETFLTYSRNLPIDVIEFSDGAFFRSPEERLLFFGGINGFTAIRENDYVPDEYRPSIVFDRMTIFGQEQNIYDYLTPKRGAREAGLSLGYRENFFTLSFSSIDYIGGHNHIFKYKLEGMSDVWIDNGTDGSVYFTNIAPGRYTLRLKGVDPETAAETDEYVLRIYIRPPWWISPAAYVVYFLLAAGASWLVVRYFIRRTERRRKRVIDAMKEQHQRDIYESKLGFFTSVAHEFCTPLTLIQGPCESILAHKESDPFVLRYAGLIQRNADRMNDLIQDLIEFRRIETGNKTPRIEPVDVSGLAESVYENFAEMAASRGFTFTRSISERVVWNSDRDFLTTILNNLVSNAFKYTNSGGSISVTLTADGREMRLAVSNTGKGIRAENIERLFDRYSILDDFEYRVGKSQVRNGLGLAISQNMAQLLGGCLEVDSEQGVETCFTMRLPLLEAGGPAADFGVPPGAEEEGEGGRPPVHSATPATPSAPSPAKEWLPDTEMPVPPIDERKPTIMVIDDERDILLFLSDIFSAEYNVIPVATPSRVEEWLRQVLPNVIICDVMMPLTDGLSITRRLKCDPRTAHIPLILVSAKHHIEEQIEGLEAGADLYITKPFSVNYLKTSVRRLILRKKMLKEYFASPISAYELSGGHLTHVDHRRFVQRVLDIINTNIASKELSAQFIADRMNMSSRQLYRKIQEAGAESPAHMIRECRLHVALDLLQNTTMTVDEIIYTSGFSNRASFFAAFSEKFGCTPREYREKHLKNIE